MLQFRSFRWQSPGSSSPYWLHLRQVNGLMRPASSARSLLSGFFGGGQYVVTRVLLLNPAIAMNTALLVYVVQMAVMFRLILVARTQHSLIRGICVNDCGLCPGLDDCHGVDHDAHERFCTWNPVLDPATP